jgi:hypothetical protein
MRDLFFEQVKEALGGGEAAVAASTTYRLDSTVISKPKGDQGNLYFDNGKVIEVTNIRVIRTGNRCEIYEYERPLKLNANHQKRINKLSRKKSERNEEYRQRRAHRAKNTIRRLANGNFMSASKFLTLTFNNDQDFDIKDIGQCHARYKLFIKKMQELNPGMKYISVIEFQLRGAVHYHILNDLPFIDKDVIAELWGHGFIDIREVDNPEFVGGYIAKYMAKNSLDPRFAFHRSYFASKNLSRPVTLYGFQTDEILAKLAKLKSNPVFENEYQSAYHGKVQYG